MKQSDIWRVFPDFEALEEVYSDVVLPGEESALEDSLPHVSINMVSSLDGRVSVDGRSGPIGSTTDRRAMRRLRSLADAVMVGSGTLRAEGVSLTSEGRRGPEPYAVIPSISLNLPLKRNLKDAVRERTLILTTESALQRAGKDRVGEANLYAELVSCPESENGGVDLRSALMLLKSKYGILTVLSEGGPGLNHSMFEERLVGELFLTLAPKIFGSPEEGTSPAAASGIVSGTLPANLPDPRLLSACVAKNTGELFLRYAIRNT